MKKERDDLNEDKTTSLHIKESSKIKFKQLKPYQLKDYEFFDAILKSFEDKK